MKDVFNTTFEVSLRILLILYNVRKDLSIDRITAIDYISIYGKDFGVLSNNLHGDNGYRFSEYSAKREIISNALKKLGLKRYVTLKYDITGFIYSITSEGICLCEALNDEYAEILSYNIKQVDKKYGEFDDRELIEHINMHAAAMF